ncbi:MAG: hypothetical protein IJ201_07285 [Solobacterium sp.]|nr:hypothetical protein [Solobacterium sp.]
METDDRGSACGFSDLSLRYGGAGEHRIPDGTGRNRRGIRTAGNKTGSRSARTGRNSLD